MPETSTHIVIDWGTSAFRAYLLTGQGEVLDSRSSAVGVKSMAGNHFADYLGAELAPWLAEESRPLLMCGMIGSSIGWFETPYLSTPCSLAQLANSLLPFKDRGMQGWIVPGLRDCNRWSMPDVLRGEEMQALGWHFLYGTQDSTETLCLPGTHSKWLTLQNAAITGFSTAMTGELYELLIRHSILATEPQHFDNRTFREGVEQASKHPGLQHQLFSARSRVLCGELAAARSHSYLSGLLIGDEVAQLQRDGILPAGAIVKLVGAHQLCELYQNALEQIGFVARVYNAESCLLASARHLLELLDQ